MQGRRVTVSLGGKDLIVNTEAVGRYLSEETKVGNGHANGNGNGNRNGNGRATGVLVDFEGRDDASQSGTTEDETENESEHEEDFVEEKWKSRPWKGTGIDVLWFKNLDHAQVFDKAATRRRVIDAITTYSQNE